MGQFLGRAILDGQAIFASSSFDETNNRHPVRLAQFLYKHLLCWPIQFSDLATVDESAYQTLKDLQNKRVESVDDDEDDTVAMHWKRKLMDDIQPQLEAMLGGFYEVLPLELLTAFSCNDMEFLLHGIPSIDVKRWKERTEYSGEFYQIGGSHPVCQWFWELISPSSSSSTANDGSDEDDDVVAIRRAKVLEFVTGSSKWWPSPSSSLEDALRMGSGRVVFHLHGVPKSLAVYPKSQ